VRVVAPTGVGLAVNGLDVELLHQRTEMLSSNLMVLQLEHHLKGDRGIAEHQCPRKGIPQMQFIDPSHQFQIAFSGWLCLVIGRAQATGLAYRLQPALVGAGHGSSGLEGNFFAPSFICADCVS
jgi:hypothetical protein